MKVILRHRHTGRTQELILLCSQAEQRGEVSYIVCSGHREARRLHREAHELEAPIAFPITFDEFLAGRFAEHNIDNLFIDNADQLLQIMTRVPIRAVTIELERSE